MANVGTAPAGKTLIGTGNLSSPTFATIGTLSGLTNHGIILGQGAAAFVASSAGLTGQHFQSGGASADPNWTTATFPSTATGTGTILRADGTNWVATTSTYPNTNAVSTLLYASSANVMSALATANSGVLTTSATGVPSIDATNFQVLTTGVQMKGNNVNTAPPAGFIGERIESSVNGVTMVSNTSKTVTSITLTPGIWDVSALGTNFPAGGTGVTSSLIVNISTTTNTVVGLSGDTAAETYITGSLGISGAVPSYRILVSANTTYYLVCRTIFTSTICTINGRISATRVG